MRSAKRFNLVIFIVFLGFSIWFFSKSFGYDSETGQQWVARHQVGDFGLHMSLIRSFSWGDNFPPQSPFFPGKPLAYHYLFDLGAGILERGGLRIDYAINGLSVIAFTILLYLIYKIPQLIFRRSVWLGLVSVALFLFPPSWIFLDFFRQHPPGTWFYNWWYLADYLHLGPFDGSNYSTYFTLNVYLNQRHLVGALAVSLGFLYLVLPRLSQGRRLKALEVILFGALLGITAWLHTLIFFGNLFAFTLLFVVFRRPKQLLLLLFVAAILALPRLWAIAGQVSAIGKLGWNPGFLSSRPLTAGGWLNYWWLNVGIAFILIPLGVFLARPRQRLLFWSFLPLFLLANLLQLSFRIEHNHSILNYFLIVGNFYVAYFLDNLWQGNWFRKAVSLALLFLLSISGAIQIMAVKNDFRYPITGGSNNLIAWIRDSTPPNSIFVGPAQLLDPITLAGRKNFLGPHYYLEVMGYDDAERAGLVKTFFEATSPEVLITMRANKIAYILLPTKAKDDFSYTIDTGFYPSHASKVYEDALYEVYKL